VKNKIRYFFSTRPISVAQFAAHKHTPFTHQKLFFLDLLLSQHQQLFVDVVIFFALLHFFIVAASIVQPDSTAPLLEFNDVFDPSKDSQAAFMNMVTNYPNFVAEEWSHVLTWDLFVGRWIWLDGLKRGRRVIAGVWGV
jgi:hypothetical protein